MPSTRRQFLARAGGGTLATLAAGTLSLEAAMDQTKAEFEAYQATRRNELWGLLGDLPTNHKPGPPKLLKTEQRPGYRLEHLELDLNGMEVVPAYLLLPDKRPTP